MATRSSGLSAGASLRDACSFPHVPACLGRRDAIQSAMASENRAAAVEHTVMNANDSHPGLSILSWDSSFAMSPPIIPMEIKRSPTPMKAHKFQAASNPNFKDLRRPSVANGRSRRAQSTTATPARAKSGPYMGEVFRSMAINATTPAGISGPTKPRTSHVTEASGRPWRFALFVTRYIQDNFDGEQLRSPGVLHQ
jgi:hypothetical protein